MNRLFALLLATLLAACATPVKMVRVDTGEAAVGERLLVRSDGRWNTFSGAAAGVVTWTHDGLPLDTLRFFTDIADGQPIVPANPNVKRGSFRKGMRAHEIVALFEAEFTRDGSVFTLDRLEPASIAGEKGFRFEFQLLRKGDELHMRGIGQGVEHDGKLYALVFVAPRIAFFDRHAPRARQVFDSVRFKG
jgi:hypothetical protein